MSKNQKGITLIEVIVALAVLSIGIIGILQSFPAAAQKEGIAKNNSTAAYLAQGQLETLLSYDYDNPLLSTGTTTTSTLNYYIQTNVAYIDPLDDLNATDTDLGIKRIKIKVFWGRDVPEQTVELSTLYSRK
ncbi:MAG: prepilin-type N-terminal cleavage/methylation domain-containing protein [Candidatus Paceibacterota bacterium]|jgi:prepilin-type N-terminal cleavage/methylation domain-containing protein